MAEVLVLAGVHAAAEAIAHRPEGAVEFGFLEGHVSLFSPGERAGIKTTATPQTATRDYSHLENVHCLSLRESACVSRPRGESEALLLRMHAAPLLAEFRPDRCRINLGGNWGYPHVHDIGNLGKDG
jgi:hypothetical protein